MCINNGRVYSGLIVFIKCYSLGRKFLREIILWDGVIEDVYVNYGGWDYVCLGMGKVYFMWKKVW